MLLVITVCLLANCHTCAQEAAKHEEFRKYTLEKWVKYTGKQTSNARLLTESFIRKLPNKYNSNETMS